MSESLHSGKTIAKNTIYNLFGYGIPLIFAIVLIPYLIKGLGEEKFGILNLAWVIVGYFSFLDFGIGRSLTKIIAEKLGTNQVEEIPHLFWTSFFLLLGVSIIFTIVLLFLTPILVLDFFKISEALQTETLHAFYLLALSVPIVTTSAGIRGVLEAYQKFAVINIIRTTLGVFLFLGPLLCLIFTNSLFWIVLVLVVIRLVILVLYVSQCFKVNQQLRNNLTYNTELVKPILKYSGWITVSNVIVPIIIYIDRFLIGALVSATAITYYATPYEVISKLLLVPGAITGVLFPAVSASYLSNPNFTKKLSIKAIKYIFILLYPIILLILAFSHEGLDLWLGKEFAEKSTLILQLMTIGILFNSIAYIPFTYLQGIGKPEITAFIQLIELPIYLIAMWIAIKDYGINGAALVWMLRIILDALLLFMFAKKHILSSFEFKLTFNQLLLSGIITASFFIILITNVAFKSILVGIILIIFTFLIWRYFLAEDEKLFVTSRLKMLNF